MCDKSVQKRLIKNRTAVIDFLKFRFPGHVGSDNDAVYNFNHALFSEKPCQGEL